MENTKNKKPIVWIGIGVGACLLISACVFGAISLGVGGLFWLGSQTPENIITDIDIPVSSEVGDNIVFEITITNTGTNTIKLNSIDISLNYLDGISVEYTTPPYTETSQYGGWIDDELYQSFYYTQLIEPGETLSIVFYGQAILAGDFSGELDICIDSESNCQTNIVRTIIK